MVKKKNQPQKRQQCDRRDCNPDKCKNVLKERRKTNKYRRKVDEEKQKAYEEKVIREYHENYANDLRKIIKEWVAKVYPSDVK